MTSFDLRGCALTAALRLAQIHPDSTEHVASFIESQEAVIAKIEEKRGEFGQLIKRGEKLEGQADCPPFLKEQVKDLSELFTDSETKAKKKLKTLKRESLRPRRKFPRIRQTAPQYNLVLRDNCKV